MLEDRSRYIRGQNLSNWNIENQTAWAVLRSRTGVPPVRARIELTWLSTCAQSLIVAP